MKTSIQISFLSFFSVSVSLFHFFFFTVLLRSLVLSLFSPFFFRLPPNPYSSSINDGLTLLMASDTNPLFPITTGKWRCPALVLFIFSPPIFFFHRSSFLHFYIIVSFFLLCVLVCVYIPFSFLSIERMPYY